MSGINLRLNIRSPANPSKKDSDQSEGLSKAAEKKRSNIETMDEAWTRIFNMKNSAPDQRRLAEVKQAMDAGEIGREPGSAGKRFSKAEALRLWAELEDLNRYKRLEDLVDEMPDNYLLILDEASLDKAVENLRVEEKIVFDVETTGTDVFSDHIVGHVLSATNLDIHYYIPTDHDDTLPQLNRDYVAEKLRPIYENPNIGLIAHNAKNLVL